MYHGLHRFAWGRWVGLVGTFLLGSGSLPAWAGTFSWTGGDGTSQLWSTGSNWSGGTAPTSASDTVINFDVMNNPGTSTNRLQQDIANPFLLNEMTFGHNADVSYYLDGGPLQFVANAGTQPMFRNYGWYDKHIYNAIQVPSGTTLRLINDTYNVRLYGVISGGGTLQMEAQSGGGEWHLYGTNTYTGGTVYNGTANSNQGYCRLAVYASGGLGTGLVTLNGGNISTATQTQPRAGLHFMTANTSFSNNFFLQADSPIFASATGISLSGNVDTNGKTLYLRGTGSATISGVISGSGSVTKLDTGTWTLSGNNTYTGTTTIAEGTLKLGNEGALGTSAGKTVIQSGATLDINGYRAGTSTPGNEPIEVQGSGVDGGGAIVNNGSSDQTQAFSNITLLGDTTFGGSRRWDARSGTLKANGYTITKVGGSTVALVGMTVQNPGNLIVQAGTFRLESSTNFNGGSGQQVQIASGARLDFWGSSQTFTFNVLLNGGRLTSNGSGSPTVSGTVTLNATSSFEAATEWGNGSKLTLSGKITGTGGAAIKGYTSTYSHYGTVIFSNSTNDYAGDTVIETGTLQLGASEVIPHGTGKGNVVLNAGTSVAGILDLNGFNETINGLSGTTGTVLGRVVNNKSGTTATLTVGAGDATATFAGILADNTGTGGTLALVKTGTGTQTLSGPLNYTGGTTVNGGVLVLAQPGLGWTTNGQFGSSGHVLTVNSGATLRLTERGLLGNGQSHQLILNGGTVEFLHETYQSRIEMTGGRIVSTPSGSIVNVWRTGNAGNGQITVKASANSSTIEGRLTLVKTASATKTTFDVEDGPAAQDLIVSAQIVDHGGGYEGMELVKSGAGTMVLSGNNSYIGPTTILAGKLLLTGTHTPATTPGLYTVGAGGLLGGTGTTKAPVLVQGTIAPGASVGTIHTGSQTWAPAGTYQWEIQDVDAGPGTGWDLVDITGTLDITATPAQPFVIDVVSLGAGGLPGLVGDFNPLGVYSWEIARTTGGVSGFSPEKFLVDLDNFQNSWHGGRWWVSLGNQGNSVFLNYAIPEPSSGLLALLALVGLGLWRWLNRSNILAE